MKCDPVSMSGAYDIVSAFSKPWKRENTKKIRLSTKLWINPCQIRDFQTTLLQVDYTVLNWLIWWLLHPPMWLRLYNLPTTMWMPSFSPADERKPKELGMTNTIWNNPSGAEAISITFFQGLYTSYNHPNDVQPDDCKEIYILPIRASRKNIQRFLAMYQFRLGIRNKNAYEEILDTYNYSCQSQTCSWRGVDGLEDRLSPRVPLIISQSAKRGTNELSPRHGVGDWSSTDGEYYRHPFGNAPLIEKAFADYRYRSCLSR